MSYWQFFKAVPGAKYQLVATGWWQDGDETPVGPEGQPPGSESLIKRLARFGRRHPREQWMKLIGVVNHPRAWPWRELPLTAALRVLILEDPPELTSDLIPIGNGSSAELTVAQTGVLWVFANVESLWQQHRRAAIDRYASRKPVRLSWAPGAAVRQDAADVQERTQR